VFLFRDVKKIGLNEKKKKLDFMEINIKQAHIVIFQIRKSIKISETDKKKKKKSWPV